KEPGLKLGVPGDADQILDKRSGSGQTPTDNLSGFISRKLSLHHASVRAFSPDQRQRAPSRRVVKTTSYDDREHREP
ncbi:MAG: hypothetical protein VX938_06055, partial [Myxococcota bacterium]|nr:hypothetical protein [Myxococcota bacterium]